MSITAGVLPQIPERNNTKSFHHRHDSDELDVFEASRYFSYTNEVANVTHNQKTRRSGRISLDIPMITTSTTSPSQILRNEKTTKDQKKFKQPSSPGGRLASFLNSLFSNHTSSKKKKSKSSTIIEDKVDETPVFWRSKRRSSISHFPITTTTTNTNSRDNIYTIHSSSRSSGFRTPPPPHANKPTKSNDSLKAFRNSLDHRLVTSGVITTLSNKSDIPKKNNVGGNVWLGHDKLKSTNGDEKDKKCKTTTNFGNQILEVAEYRNYMDDDEDGAASDSSSDLFELPNYDLDCCSYSSSGLPVYESTRMDTIRGGAPIATGIM